MASLQMQIQNEVAEKLTKFRDEKGFVSYTDAIAELLRHYDTIKIIKRG